MLRWMTVGVGLASAALGFLPVAEAAANPWSRVAAPQTDGAQLYAISADSPTDAWATGCVGPSCDSDSTAQVLHFTDGKWVVSDAHVADVCGGAVLLTGVKAFSPKNVWASVTSGNGQSCTAGYVAHWNGTRWSVSGIPAIGDEPATGIAGTSSTNLWVSLGGSLGNPALIAHRTAVGWEAITPTKNTTRTGEMYAVAPLDATRALAVGDAYQAQTDTARPAWSEGRQAASSWSLHLVPYDGAGTYQTLLAVTSSSARDVWAAGTNGSNELVEHYNGQTWTVNDPPILPPDSHILLGIAEHGATNVWTVGSRGAKAPDSYNLLDHWNGTAWQSYGGPNPGPSGNALQAITAIPGTSNGWWAVGSYSASGVDHDIILHCC